MNFQMGLTFWAAIGPVVGIILGHVLSRKWQYRQWKLENRRQEYRELLTALTSAYMQMQRFKDAENAYDERRNRSDNPDNIDVDGLTEQRFRLEMTKMESFRVLRDRIVIADELEAVDALGRWADAFHNFETDGNERRFSDRFTEIIEMLVRIARNRVR